MIHFYCSAVEYLSQKSYKYTCVGLVWRSANSLPSSSVCLSLPSRESRPPFDSASYRAPAEARSRTRRFSALDGRRRHLLTLSLAPVSRTPRSARLGTPQQSLLGLGSSHPDSILLPPNSLGARSRSPAFSSIILYYYVKERAHEGRHSNCS